MTSATAQEAPCSETDSHVTVSTLPSAIATTEAAQSSEESLENTRDIAFQAIDQMIDISKRMGDTENVAVMQADRDRSAIDERQWTMVVASNSYAMAEYLRKRGEFLSADQLMPSVLQLAEALKDDLPSLFVAAYHQAALLDIDFERYESALSQLSVVLNHIEESEIARRDTIALRANYAYVLRRLKRFDEAEQIYVELIEQTKSDPDGRPEDLSNLRLALAVLYANKGEYRRYHDMLADDGHEQNEVRVNADPDRAITIITAFVHYSVSEGENLPFAAQKAQELVEWTQKLSGVSSRRHVEALELLAKVRAAELRYNDAVRLLKKSAELRSVLLGPTHPSVARLQTEINALRKQQLDTAAPVWTPIVQESISGPAGLYSFPELSNDNDK
jgi:tetratricopeptide (TPR) repeat protein